MAEPIRPEPMWHRNFGRGIYHADGPRWIQNGRAVCGADISKPAFVARDIAAIERLNTGRHQFLACRKCAAKVNGGA